MADFGTILNPNNDTLNLYVKSITLDDLIVYDLTVNDTAIIKNISAENEVIQNDLLVGRDIFSNSLVGNSFIATFPLVGKLQSFNQPYFYAKNLNTVVYDVSVELPIIMNKIISNDIKLTDSNDAITFNVAGIYSFNANASGANTTDISTPFSTPAPVIGLIAVLYNQLGIEVTRSNLCSISFEPKDAINLSNNLINTNCIFDVSDGYSVEFHYNASSTPTVFSVSFFSANISVNFIGFA